jgi:glycosyltransferase involved in cell wall biosynthesis
VKIALVAPSPVPFVLGGAERLMHGLQQSINASTAHDAELIKLPVREDNLVDLMAAYHRFSELDLAHFDAVISSKYPAWMVHHPNHAVYMMHPLRGLYEMYGVFGLTEEVTPAPGLSRLLRALEEATTSASELLTEFDGAVRRLGAAHPAFAFPGPLARRLVHRLDQIALAPDRMTGHLSISATVARRPGYFASGVDVTVAIPPSGLAGLHCESFDHFFTASRLDGPKRLDLLIEAFNHVDGRIKLTIGGSGPERDRLVELARGNPRITFAGYLTDEELVEHYARARAVPFLPIDEDLGLVTLEAQMSGKPVITCTDSGGSTELVEHGVTGLVVEPNVEQLASALRVLARDEQLARDMGAAGRISATRYTWDSVIDALLQAITTSAPAAGPSWPAMSRARPKLVALSTYVIDPPHGGGSIRANHLYRAAAKYFDVEFIAVGDPLARLATHDIAPGLSQTVVPRSARQTELESRLAQAVPVPIGDIATALYAVENEVLVDVVRRASRHAALATVVHPYCLPVLQTARPSTPFVLDSHNAEYILKDDVLPHDDVSLQLRAAVRALERDAMRRAELITYCTTSDRAALLTLGPTLADWLHVPNGADARAIRFTPGPERRLRRRRLLTAMEHDVGRHIAVFVGSAHPPNIDAADAIADFAPQLPAVVFLLLGGHAEQLVGRHLPENVVTMGSVPEQVLQALLRSADLALNPMRRGSGSNLKVAEAFAAGLPVISTATGARGFDVVHDRELFIATIEEFPAAIASALSDVASSDRRAAMARRMVETTLDWSVLGERFARGLLDATRSRGELTVIA